MEKKALSQWFIKTTQLSSDLYEGLEDSELEDWKDIKVIQQNWIGKCEGTRLKFNTTGNLMH